MQITLPCASEPSPQGLTSMHLQISGQASVDLQARVGQCQPEHHATDLLGDSALEAHDERREHPPHRMKLCVYSGSWCASSASCDGHLSGCRAQSCRACCPRLPCLVQRGSAQCNGHPCVQQAHRHVRGACQGGR